MTPQELKIAEALKNQRKSLGISADKLAKASGTTRLTINRIESGVFLPNTSLLLKIAENLSLNILICNLEGKNIVNN